MKPVYDGPYEKDDLTNHPICEAALVTREPLVTFRGLFRR